MSITIETIDPQKGYAVVAGHIEGDTFVKKVNSKKHFMLRVNGYGISEDAFKKIRNHMASRIIIHEQDTGEIWTSRIDDWMAHGKLADYGAGKQRFLSIKYMTSKSAQRENAAQKKLL